MPRITKNEKLAQARSVIDGVSERFATRKKLLIAGKEYTPQDIIALYQSHVDAIRAAENARVLYTAAVRKEQSIGRRTRALALQLKLIVHNEFGLAPAAWGAFGWKLPKKPGPKTVAAKLEGVKKREARRTRKGSA